MAEIGPDCSDQTAPAAAVEASMQRPQLAVNGLNLPATDVDEASKIDVSSSRSLEEAAGLQVVDLEAAVTGMDNEAPDSEVGSKTCSQS
jgi:hypothetical protein